jgi:hypothetical protein
VITRILPAALAIGIAQHTTRGLARPLVLLMAKNEDWGLKVVQGCEVARG